MKNILCFGAFLVALELLFFGLVKCDDVTKNAIDNMVYRQMKLHYEVRKFATGAWLSSIPSPRPTQCDVQLNDCVLQTESINALAQWKDHFQNKPVELRP